MILSRDNTDLLAILFPTRSSKEKHTLK